MCWLQWQSQVKELPPSNHVPLPTHAFSRGTLNGGTEATPRTAVPEVLGLAAANKHRPSPPANSGATFTAWQFFQPRSPGTSRMQEAQKVPSPKHCHLRNKGKVRARRDGAGCSEQASKLEHGSHHRPHHMSITVHLPLQNNATASSKI